MVEEFEKALVERHTGAENSAEHHGCVDNIAFGCRERCFHFNFLVVDCSADFVGHNLPDSFEVDAKTEHVLLNVHVAQFHHELADERRRFCKIYNFHIIMLKVYSLKNPHVLISSCFEDFTGDIGVVVERRELLCAHTDGIDGNRVACVAARNPFDSAREIEKSVEVVCKMVEDVV